MSESFPLGAFEDTIRVFSILKRNDLGTDSVGRWGVPSSVNVFISMATLRRMHAVMA